MEVAFIVGLGGAVGAILRWWVGVVMSHLLAPVFLGTLVVNLIGSFMIGFLLVCFQERLPISDVLRTGIFVGLLGGFTTYSAFSMETLNMIMVGSYGRASGYVAGTVAVCLMGTWAGVMLGRSV